MNKNMIVRFGKWKTETKVRHRGDTTEKERIMVRSVKINEYDRLEEGIIIKQEERRHPSKIFIEKGHNVGYHYISLISHNEDMFWIQGNIRSKHAIFEKKYCGVGFNVILNWTDKEEAMTVFLKFLKKKNNIVLKESQGLIPLCSFEP